MSEEDAGALMTGETWAGALKTGETYRLGGPLRSLSIATNCNDENIDDI
jgi:hypothetical protein